MLSVENLDVFYGDAQALDGVSLEVEQGAIVAIVGANGAGKTTLLSTIAGLVRPTAGRITFRGTPIDRRPAYGLASDGLCLVPEGGRLFPFMTVEENLQLGAFASRARAGMAKRLDEVMAMFPVLQERRTQLAGRLSGGERQMCAIGRALMAKPALLMLDEPSVGLSPLMVGRVFDIVTRLARQDGLTIVLVEQNVTEALEVADRAYVLDHGSIVRSGEAASLRGDREIQEAYMGL